jgi:hypothetical protein
MSTLHGLVEAQVAPPDTSPWGFNGHELSYRR